MMISTKGRYALRVMIDLASHMDEGFISINSIAQRQGLSQKYLEALMGKLNKANFVESHRGKNGGYQLSKSPEEYTVREILNLAEGNLIPVNCGGVSEEGSCLKSDNCPTFHLWEELQQTIDSFLEKKTLKDLLK